jgi:hypothetical protein
MKKIVAALATSLVLGLGMTACTSDADVASENLSRDADNFKILRRIVFYNGVTGEYILSVEGYCSLGNNDPEHKLTVTCKTGKDLYKKHFLGLSDNVTYFAEQIDAASVSVDHYKVVFKPSTIIPAPEVR